MVEKSTSTCYPTRISDVLFSGRGCRLSELFPANMVLPFGWCGAVIIPGDPVSVQYWMRRATHGRGSAHYRKFSETGTRKPALVIRDAVVGIARARPSSKPDAFRESRPAPLARIAAPQQPTYVSRRTEPTRQTAPARTQWMQHLSVLARTGAARSSANGLASHD